jgi:hypothetical protein
MDFETLKILHLLGAFGLFTALGAICLQALSGHTARRPLLSALHGGGLLLMLITGLAMLMPLARAGGPMGWSVGKLVIWLILGGVTVLPKRKPETAKWLLWVIPLLGGLAAWLAIAKPF